QPLSTAKQPRDRVGRIGWRLATLDGTGVKEVVESVAHDLRRPAVAAADVAEQLLEAPPGAGRHRLGLVDIAEKLRKSAVLFEECGGIVHPVRLLAGVCRPVRPGHHQRGAQAGSATAARSAVDLVSSSPARRSTSKGT